MLGKSNHNKIFGDSLFGISEPPSEDGVIAAERSHLSCHPVFMTGSTAKRITTKILFLVLSLFAISACAKKKPIFHTEIICPTGKVILMRYATEAEMRVAIQRAAFEKRLFGTSENYTVARFPGNRSVKIEKIPPEEMLRCQLRQIVADEKSIKDARYYLVN